MISFPGKFLFPFNLGNRGFIFQNLQFLFFIEIISLSYEIFATLSWMLRLVALNFPVRKSFSKAIYYLRRHKLAQNHCFGVLFVIFENDFTHYEVTLATKDRFRTISNIYDRTFCKNNQWHFLWKIKKSLIVVMKVFDIFSSFSGFNFKYRNVRFLKLVHWKGP